MKTDSFIVIKDDILAYNKALEQYDDIIVGHSSDLQETEPNQLIDDIVAHETAIVDLDNVMDCYEHETKRRFPY